MFRLDGVHNVYRDSETDKKTKECTCYNRVAGNTGKVDMYTVPIPDHCTILCIDPIVTYDEIKALHE